MIPDQQLQRTKTIEIGKTYFRVGHPGDGYEIFTAMSEDQTTAWTYSAYFGPIDTTPSLIDLSHFDLSKIEPKKQPDKPGLWHCSKRLDGHPDLTQFVSRELMSDGRKWMHAEYRFLCDFIPPKQSPVIPPKPENVLHLMRLTKQVSVSDGNEGEMRWCVLMHNGKDFRTLLNGKLVPGVVWLASQCEPVTE